jgi:hypothetical protein
MSNTKLLASSMTMDGISLPANYKLEVAAKKKKEKRLGEG